MPEISKIKISPIKTMHLFRQSIIHRDFGLVFVLNKVIRKVIYDKTTTADCQFFSSECSDFLLNFVFQGYRLKYLPVINKYNKFPLECLPYPS